MGQINLSDIIIYPVKSLGGISLNSSFAGMRGLKHDRRWMIIDLEGRFLSQRKLPQLATFSVKLVNKGFEIYHAGDKIQIPFHINTFDRILVNVWESHLYASRAEKYFNEWFSDHLKYPCNLVYMDDSVYRYISVKYQVHKEFVSFADSFPYLIIGEASLQDLNFRLTIELPMNRFRPNFVFSGGKAFDEDRFGIFEMGQAKFKAVKPCARCIVTTTDQGTGEKGREPLFTLATFRKKNNKVLFGQNLICLREGAVHIGDKITFHEDMHLE